MRRILPATLLALALSASSAFAWFGGGWDSGGSSGGTAASVTSGTTLCLGGAAGRMFFLDVDKLNCADGPTWSKAASRLTLSAEASIGQGHSLLALTMYGDPGEQHFARARGTLLSPAALQLGDTIGAVLFEGYDGTAFSTWRGGVSGSAAQNWTGSAHGLTLGFYVTPRGATAPVNAGYWDADGALYPATENLNPDLGTVPNHWRHLFLSGDAYVGGRLTTGIDAVPLTDLAGKVLAARVNNLAESQVTNLVTDLGAKAADSAVVHNTGTETIAGAKTFSTVPVLGTLAGILKGTAGTITGGLATIADLASSTSANLASVLSDETGSAGGGVAVFSKSPTIETPTIASHVNAQHDHSNAAGGGNIAEAAVTNLTTDLAAKSASFTDSAGLAGLLSDETGSSGGFVRAGSPTLVTPALGTPSAMIATNVTGLPEGGLSTTDVTTNNATTSKHGFLPKLSNVATQFLDGTGLFSTPASGAKMQFTTTSLNMNLLSGTTAKIAKMSGYGVSIDGSLSDNCSAAYFVRVVMAGTFKNLSCSVNNSFASGSVTVALGDGNCTTAASALITSALDSGNSNASDSTHTVAVSANTIRSFVFTPSTPIYTANPTAVTCSVEFDPS